MLPNQTLASSVVVAPANVHATIARHMLADGEHLVVDLLGSHGPYLRDAKTGREYLDFYAYFASQPVGHNHPALCEPAFVQRIGDVARYKPANSDVYTTYLAEFVETFARIARPADMPYLFFVDGGALAVENALKTAMDWKVRKNLATGKGEKGNKIIHFREAFHGRSGYTLSLTNTADPRKHIYFAKFDWPRITNPKLRFPVTKDVLGGNDRRGSPAVAEIEQAVRKNPDEIAAVDHRADPGRGRRQSLPARVLRPVAPPCRRTRLYVHRRRGADRHGATGKMWAIEHMGVKPDIIAFGKKAQSVRHHRRAARGRGARQRVPRLQPHQLNVGR